MALILSPWPDESTPEETEAIAYLGPFLGVKFGAGDTPVRQLGSMAALRVEREAPNAPQAVRNEAVRMYAGYFAQSGYGSVRSIDTVGSQSIQFTVNAQRAWINCGAKALLAPWKPLGGASVAHKVEAE